MLRAGLLVCLAVGALANSANINTHWNGGFQGKACIDFTKEMSGWDAILKFDQAVDKLDTWVAEATKVGDGKEWKLHNMPWNADEHVGDQVCIDFVAHVNGDISPSVEVVMDGGSSGGSGQTQIPGQTPAPGQTVPPVAKPTAPHTGGGSATFDYGKALGLSILFYDAQRSGKLPANNPVPWRDDSALQDKGDNGEDLTGGWYDAGDHVKFGFPMASTSTLLLWGLEKWKDGYEAAGQLDTMYDMIKWPLDYYLKAWIPAKKTFYVQVGNGNQDHTFWGRPEDMTMARPAYKLTEGMGGSDIAGETAASLAAGSIVFKDKVPDYSAKLLTAAKSLYEFGKRNPGTYSSSVQAAAQFYSSSGYTDEMCEAAVWLYKATKEAKYLEDAKSFRETAWGWALSWDDKKVACQMLLYEVTQDSRYKKDVEGFFKGWLPGGGITYTPCGLAWRDQWGSTRYAANSAFLALVAADAGIQTLTYRKWAISQINYLLGANGQCQSFEIGFGSKYPERPHHRGASCPDRPAPCSDANLHSSAPSPQLLKGALVGGPDAQGHYKDDREDYVHNEVACDYNSGFQSALAGLAHLKATDDLPPADPPKCHC